MNSREYIDEVVMRTCSDSGRNLDKLIDDLRILDEQTNGKAATLLLAGFGMNEAGEIGDMVKKLAFHGKPFDDTAKDYLKKELGDLLWYCGCLCDVLETTFEETMEINRGKLEARYPNGFSPQAAEARIDAILPTNPRPKVRNVAHT